MIAARDLLNQARALARREPRRPRQASLRRAVSTGYYALFHLLVSEACRRLAPGRAAQELRAMIARAFQHGEMHRAAVAFAGRTLPARVAPAALGRPVPADLAAVADVFAWMQEQRHSADYDPRVRFTRGEVENALVQVTRAFEAWARVRRDPLATVFLLSLLVLRRVERR